MTTAVVETKPEKCVSCSRSKGVVDHLRFATTRSQFYTVVLKCGELDKCAKT